MMSSDEFPAITAIAINVLGWVGAGVLVFAYWLVSTQKTIGDSTLYQLMNVLGAALVLTNSLYFGAYPSVAVNAVWIVIGAYALAKARGRSATAAPLPPIDHRSTLR